MVAADVQSHRLLNILGTPDVLLAAIRFVVGEVRVFALASARA